MGEDPASSSRRRLVSRRTQPRSGLFQLEQAPAERPGRPLLLGQQPVGGGRFMHASPLFVQWSGDGSWVRGRSRARRAENTGAPGLSSLMSRLIRRPDTLCDEDGLRWRSPVESSRPTAAPAVLTPSDQPVRRQSRRRALVQAVVAVRSTDPASVESALRDLGGRRRWFAPLAYAAGRWRWSSTVSCCCSATGGSRC